MIYRLVDLIGAEDCKSGPDALGRWSRAVPVRYYGGYLSAAWAVLRGRAVAVQYPESGELEQALHDTGGIQVGDGRRKTAVGR
jgi:hypothetical protein